MIKNLYVIKDTGQCLYHLKFYDIKIKTEKVNKYKTDDPNIISGFFAAILAFANAVEGNNGINKLFLENSNYYFIKQDTIHFIIDTDHTNSKFTEEDYFVLLQKCAGLINEYMLENHIDDSFMVITNSDELSSQIKALISQKIREKILGISSG